MRSRRSHPDRHLDLVSLRERLSENAFLFEHPEAYAAGVADALEQVSEVLTDAEAEEEPLTVDG